ncbi:carboxynorspermidine decarboxylase [Butyrivibrio sp. LB2008]|uniref:carboxynorspermidine decarboxylase n=1 Tax=Butyrivibrio sp. LB2008 TaxID=1408305 RepID=UPI00047B2927|nr:carboxynorspermidine decarboxylase [Butyrivibrio sp. LB2008]
MNISEIATPAYVIDEQKLLDNLNILSEIASETGAKILLAQKAFSAYSTYPLIAEYLQGATASGLYEAKLAYEEMVKPFEGKKKIENHVFEPAFKDAEFPLVCEVADHIVFNSIAQLEHHRAVWEKAVSEKGLSVGLRINPEFSTQEGHEIYDPCAPGSRLGIRRENLPDPLPKGVEGLHFHTLCEQGFEPLEATFKEVEQDFGEFFAQIKWLNLGGGHHITKPDYDREGLKNLIRYIKETYDLEVYLEPGEAVALDAGYLVTTVMDIVETEDYPVLILDTSAACHMPDVLEMPYRPPLKDSGLCDEKAYTYRLSSRTCLAGDVIGDYSFDNEIKIGDRLTFEDMAIYSMVKNNTFNGMPLPDIDIMHKDGSVDVLKTFSYDDFKSRL